MRFVRKLILFVSIFALVGCAGAGREFDSTHAKDVQKGVHDKAQIQAWFGAPYQSLTLTGQPAGCTERWTYIHAWSNWGGAQTTTRTLVVDFDSNGVVCDQAFVEQ
jgi:outer membrane protein assembly factor BamE (lipoprotein component of BamABCDE complex)